MIAAVDPRCGAKSGKVLQRSGFLSAHVGPRDLSVYAGDEVLPFQ